MVRYSGVPEQQRVALPANVTYRRVLAFCDLVTFVHQHYAEILVLVGSLASGLWGKKGCLQHGGRYL